MLVTPSEFNIIKVPESNAPMSLLIHSSSILQSSYRPPFLILHLASPLFTQDDLKQIVKLETSQTTVLKLFKTLVDILTFQPLFHTLLKNRMTFSLISLLIHPKYLFSIIRQFPLVLHRYHQQSCFIKITTISAQL